MKVHVVNVTRPDPGDRRSYARPHRRSGAAGRGARVCRAVGHRTRSAGTRDARSGGIDERHRRRHEPDRDRHLRLAGPGTAPGRAGAPHPVIARDDRRPAPARSRLRLDAGRFRPRRSRLYTTLQGADAGARHDAAGLARRDARRRHADPVARHRGRAGAAARRLAQQALDRLCRRAVPGLDRVRAIPEARGAGGRHQILPRRRRKAGGAVECHHRPARRRLGHAVGRQGANHADRRRGGGARQAQWIRDVGFDDVLCMARPDSLDDLARLRDAL